MRRVFVPEATSLIPAPPCRPHTSHAPLTTLISGGGARRVAVVFPLGSSGPPASGVPLPSVTESGPAGVVRRRKKASGSGATVESIRRTYKPRCHGSSWRRQRERESIIVKRGEARRGNEVGGVNDVGDVGCNLGCLHRHAPPGGGNIRQAPTKSFFVYKKEGAGGRTKTRLGRSRRRRLQAAGGINIRHAQIAKANPKLAVTQFDAMFVAAVAPPHPCGKQQILIVEKKSTWNTLCNAYRTQKMEHGRSYCARLRTPCRLQRHELCRISVHFEEAVARLYSRRRFSVALFGRGTDRFDIPTNHDGWVKARQAGVYSSSTVRRNKNASISV